MRRLSLFGFVVLAALAVAACGGAGTTSGSSAPTATVPAASSALACERVDAVAEQAVAVTIKDFKFVPQPVKATVGEIIIWANDDSAPHTASLADGSCGTDQIGPGAHAALVFRVAGTYTYQCNVHPTQMKDYTIEIAQ